MSIYTFVLLIISAISLAIYLFYLIIFDKGIKRNREQDLSYQKRTVSVIIAARNEEANIIRTLTSLVNQSYPTELYEIIVVDDRSTDRTAEIVKEFSQKWSNIKLVQITESVKGESPKKHALSSGIAESRGEVLLLTDADCLVTKYWVESMVANFREGVSVVCGFSRVRIDNWKKSALLTRFEYFDFLVMFIAAAGSIFSKRYFSCSNQNFAYLRSAYDKVGGFGTIKHILSGDDVNLLQLYRKAGLGISFSLNRRSFVHTEPVRNYSQLFSQRSRWASNAKWQLTLNPEFFFYLSAVFLLHTTSIALIFFDWKMALILFALRMLSDFWFIKRHFRLFEEQKTRLNFFPLWFILQPLYLVVVTVRGLFGVFKWKTN